MKDGGIDPSAGTVSVNPATGEMIRDYLFQVPEAVEETLAANAAAARAWRDTKMSERVRCYRRLAATLRERSEPLARLATTEMGKTIMSARAEVEKCASAFEWFAEHGPAMLADEQLDADGDHVYVSYLPIGTVLAVMPWNFPFWQVSRAAAPIMLSGNGFILKHAPNVMGCAYAMQDAYDASGFPRGLFTNLHATR